MGILDDFLLGRSGDNKSLDSAILRDYLGSKIVGLSNKGVVFERPDNRASTLGAATALQRTTGRIPEGFFNRVNEKAPNTLGSSTIAFDGDKGQDIFASLRNQGIGVGSTLGQILTNGINGQANTAGGADIRELLANVLGEANKSPVAKGGFGSVTDSANNSASSANQKNPADFAQRFLDSFKRKQQGALKPLNEINPNDSAKDRAENFGLF